MSHVFEDGPTWFLCLIVVSVAPTVVQGGEHDCQCSFFFLDDGPAIVCV